MAFLTFVLGCLVGWFGHHFFGAKAQAVVDAEKVKLEEKITAKTKL